MSTRLAILFLFFVPILSAGQAEQPFSMGVEAYANHQYQEALQFFQQHLASTPGDAAAHFNLGNCYFRLQQPGLARYHYEMAAIAGSSSEDARYNIGLIEENLLPTELHSANFTGFEVTMKNLLQLLKPELMFWLGAVAFLAINLVVFIRITAPSRLNATVIWLLLIPLGLVLIVSIAVVGGFHYLNNQINFAVVVDPVANAYSEPSPRAPGRFPVPEAALARVKRVRDGWLEIMLPDKTTGWMKSESLGLLKDD